MPKSSHQLGYRHHGKSDTKFELRRSTAYDHQLHPHSSVGFNHFDDGLEDDEVLDGDPQVMSENENDSKKTRRRLFSPSESIFRFIRGIVSKKKKRMQEAGFDLDLSYITERIIAMGFPADDDSFSSNFRNPMSEVVRFLDEFHPGKYRVYNLCIEKRYPASKFHHRAVRYPFDDHNCPPFDMILDFCHDVDEWLNADPDNIVVVHCKAGKGRTGLMISSYLVYCHFSDTADHALEHFGYQRTSNGKGVTIPSQIRYVHYFEEFVTNYYRQHIPFPMQGVPIKITSMTMNSIPHFDADGGSDPYVMVNKTNKEILYDSRKIVPPAHYTPRKKRHTEVELEVKSMPILVGDVKFLLIDQDSIGKDDLMGSFWINTAFLPKEGVLELSRKEVDKAHKDKKNKHFDKGWKIKVTYQLATEE